jgi:UDP-glucose 4-epimerase
MSRRAVGGGSFLVSGAAGFIGSHLVDELLAAGAERVVGIDDLSLGRLENLDRALADARFEFAACDCALDGQLEHVISDRRPEACFNLAVIPLPAALVDPKKVVERNVAMTTSACELLRQGRFDTLVQFSSSEVYGSATGDVLAENDPQAPETPYAASKAATDAVAASYHRTFGLSVVLVRPFNTYGPRQNAGSYAALIPNVLARLAAGEPIVVDGDGEQTRDYLFVEDAVAGTIAAYERLPADGRAVNLGSGSEVSVNAVVRAVLHAAGASDHPVVHGPARPGDVRRQRADIARARSELAFEPRVGFPQGIRRTVASYL